MFCLFLVYMFVYPVTKLTNWVMNKHQLVVHSIKREINFQFCYSSLCLYYPSLIIFFFFSFSCEISLSLTLTHSHTLFRSLVLLLFFFFTTFFHTTIYFFCLNFYNQSTLLLYSYTLVIIFGHYKEVIRIR